MPPLSLLSPERVCPAAPVPLHLCAPACPLRTRLLQPAPSLFLLACALGLQSLLLEVSTVTDGLLLSHPLPVPLRNHWNINSFTFLLWISPEALLHIISCTLASQDRPPVLSVGPGVFDPYVGSKDCKNTFYKQKPGNGTGFGIIYLLPL